MTNKIKVIDLLNKIASIDKPPKEIKWNNHIYIYDEQYDDYYEETTALFENEMSNGMLFKSLNDEVEIIEDIEPKEIEKWGKSIFEEFDKELPISHLQHYLKLTMETQNEIIDYLLKKEENKHE